jgi:hypothetical protein
VRGAGLLCSVLFVCLIETLDLLLFVRLTGALRCHWSTCWGLPRRHRTRLCDCSTLSSSCSTCFMTCCELGRVCCLCVHVSLVVVVARTRRGHGVVELVGRAVSPLSVFEAERCLTDCLRFFQSYSSKCVSFALYLCLFLFVVFHFYFAYYDVSFA